MYSYEETMRMLAKAIDDICDAMDNLHACTIGSDCLFVEDMVGECRRAIDSLETADEIIESVYVYMDEEAE